MNNDERYEVKNDEIERHLKSIGRTIKETLPNGWGFTLFLYTYDKGATFYLSSGEREGMITLLEEFIAKEKAKCE